MAAQSGDLFFAKWSELLAVERIATQNIQSTWISAHFAKDLNCGNVITGAESLAMVK